MPDIDIGERHSLFCADCGTELIRNEILMRCPKCNIVDFTEQGEAGFHRIAEICREQEIGVVDLRRMLNNGGQ